MTRHTNRGWYTHASTSLPRPLGRGDRELSAGPHVLDLVALDTAGTGPARLPEIALTLPSGWRSYKGYAVLKSHMGLSFWDVDHVYGTPCRWQSKGMVDPGTTVGGLASALARQPLRSATTPTNAVLAGVRGKYVRLSVPDHIDFARCDEGPSKAGLGSAGRATAGSKARAGRPDLDPERPWTAPRGRRQLPPQRDNQRPRRALPRPRTRSGSGRPTAGRRRVRHRDRSDKSGRRDRPQRPMAAYGTARQRPELRGSYGRRQRRLHYPRGQSTKARGEPREGTGRRTTWNICPTFSPEREDARLRAAWPRRLRPSSSSASHPTARSACRPSS